MKRVLFLAASLVLGMFAVFGQKSSVKSIGPRDFAAYIEKEKPQVLDVRTNNEFEQGAIKGALQIDFYGADFEKKALSLLDKKKPVAVYCRSGKRSLSAAQLLEKAGFTVVDLAGGIIAWRSAELPVE